MINYQGKICGIIGATVLAISMLNPSMAQSACSSASAGYKARVANINAYLDLYKQRRALPKSEKGFARAGSKLMHGRIWCNIERMMLENRLQRQQLLDAYPDCLSPKERGEVQEEVADHQSDLAEHCA